MKNSKASKLTQSVHAGSIGDPLFGGVVTPIYPSAAYDYETEVQLSPLLQHPNQKAAVEKLVAFREWGRWTYV
ncbi:MAG: hypothetical protein U5K54_14455 [Cytophagales bacterium]|nr:hypothetical protein [Cytophagales bacterium]